MSAAGPRGAGPGGGDRDVLAARIHAVSHLRGTFKLRSGRIADEYFDKYRFESDPVLLRDIATALGALVPAGTEGLAGLELGGVPLVTALSAHTGLPAFFVRKTAKEYGTEQVCEGGDVHGRRLTIVEDVVTTGWQVVMSTGDLRAAGAVVEDALCVIDRESGGGDAVAAEGIRLHCLFSMSEVRPAPSA